MPRYAQWRGSEVVTGSEHKRRPLDDSLLYFYTLVEASIPWAEDVSLDGATRFRDGKPRAEEKWEDRETQK